MWYNLTMQKERREELLNSIYIELFKINESISKINDEQVKVEKNIKAIKTCKKSPVLSDIAFLSSALAALLVPGMAAKYLFSCLVGYNATQSIITRIENKNLDKTKKEQMTNNMKLQELKKARNYLSFRRFCLMDEIENVKNGNEPLIGI